MPKLLIERKSEPNNKARNIDIYIDDENVGTLANGELKAYDVSVGTHEVVAKIDWFGSQKVSIDVAEVPEYGLRLSGFKHGTKTGLIIIGLLLFYVFGKFSLHVDLNLLLGLAGLVFMYPLYYMTFGRNHYLKLTPVEVVRS